MLMAWLVLSIAVTVADKQYSLAVWTVAMFNSCRLVLSLQLVKSKLAACMLTKLMLQEIVP